MRVSVEKKKGNILPELFSDCRMAFCGENFEKTVEMERAPSQINNEMLNIKNGNMTNGP